MITERWMEVPKAMMFLHQSMMPVRLLVLEKQRMPYTAD